MKSALNRTYRVHRSFRSRAFSNHNSSNNNPTPTEQHALFRDQMEELKQERESLYGFTDGEQQAWKSSNDHRHSDDFLQQVEQARAEVSSTTTTWSHSHDNHQHNHDHTHASEKYQPGYTLIPPVIQHQQQQSTNDDDGDENDDLLSSLSSLSFTHLTPDGSNVHMVHVGDKQVTARRAVAQATVVFPPEVVQHGLISKKGPIFQTAILAGIMAAK